MNCYVPIKSKKKIAEILSNIVGTQIILQLFEDGRGLAEVKIGHKTYRLTYKDCHEREDGTTHGSLSLIEQVIQSEIHPWRNSALVH